MVQRSHNPEDFTNPQEYTLKDYLLAASYLKNRKCLQGRDDIAEDKKERINNIILGMRYFQRAYELKVEDIFDIDDLAMSAEQSKNIGDIDLLALVPRPTGKEVSAAMKPQLEEAQKKYEALALMLNETTVGCWLLDFHNGSFKTINVNESLCKMLWFSEENILEKNIHEFLDESSLTMLNAQSVDILTQKHREFNLDLKVSNNAKLPVKISATCLGINDTWGHRVMAMVTDISELRRQSELLRKKTKLAEEQAKLAEEQTRKLEEQAKELEEQKHKLEEQKKALTEISITDALTGVYNRRHLNEELTNAFLLLDNGELKDISFMLIDLDHFKQVNDRYGHAAGDVVLKKVGEILLFLRSPKISVFRFGWEEFAIVGQGISFEEIKELGERLRKRIEDMEILLPGGEILKFTISAGVIHQEFGAGHDVNTFVSSADTALYFAKKSGRNRVRSPEDIN